MKPKLKEKLTRLEDYLLKKEKIAVAFSGGVDSSLLLKIAHDVLKENVKAFTIDTIYMSHREIDEAKKFTAQYNITNEVLVIPLLDIIQHNPNDRCYFCKTFLFKKILNEAKKSGFNYVADGTNLDDLLVHRPGLKALEELGIISPFKENGITKEDIRELSKNLHLQTWDKPAYACLLTRLPYGTLITRKDLQMIEESEKFIISLGFDGVRVRTHNNLARIEVLPEHLNKIMNPKLLHMITVKLKEIGYQFVTLDTEGYKQGSFDHVK